MVLAKKLTVFSKGHKVLFGDVLNRKQATLAHKNIDLVYLQNLIFCKGVNL